MQGLRAAKVCKFRDFLSLMVFALRGRAPIPLWQCACCKQARVLGHLSHLGRLGPPLLEKSDGTGRGSSAMFSASALCTLCRRVASSPASRHPLQMTTTAAVTAVTSEIDIWSFNLRTELVKEDDLENSWPKRRDEVAALIGKYNPAIVCVQEATVGMLSHLSSKSKGTYQWKGISRQPSKADECAGFLFDVEQVELLNHSVFWLSPPGSHDGDIGWDAKLPRTCESAVFKIHAAHAASAVGPQPELKARVQSGLKNVLRLKLKHAEILMLVTMLPLLLISSDSHLDFLIHHISPS